jgi:hypothetical protein
MPKPERFAEHEGTGLITTTMSGICQDRKWDWCFFWLVGEGGGGGVCVCVGGGGGGGRRGGRSCVDC